MTDDDKISIFFNAWISMRTMLGLPVDRTVHEPAFRAGWIARDSQPTDGAFRAGRIARDSQPTDAPFDPNVLPPQGIQAAVIDSMARELSSAAAQLQKLTPLIEKGMYLKARDELLDIPSLAPARQYLLGLIDGRNER